MLEKTDSILISVYKMFSELFSILSKSIEGVISRDNIRFVVGEVDFNIKSYYEVIIGSLSS